MTLLSLNSSSLENFLLQKLSRVIAQAPIRIVLPSGSEISPRDAAPAGTLVIHDRQTLLRIILSPEIEFGDAYTEGRVEIEGDLVEVLAAVFRALSGRNPGSWFARLRSKLLEWTQANTLHGSREHIHRHYDLSTDFYKLWLDSEMLYTCAYFESPSIPLETAQTRQNGSRLPQTPTSARGTSRRSRLRLGLIRALHGRTIWRPRESLQYFPGAIGLRASHGKVSRPR